VILAGGRLERYKQFDKTIRAMALLDDDVKLVITGNGTEESNLAQLAARSGLKNRVTLTGQLSVPELRRWQRTAKVLVTLSCRRRSDSP